MRDKESLNKSLQTATGLHLVYSSAEFQNFLLPHLQKLSTVEHIDPKKYSTRQEYEYALDNANREAIVYAQLLKFLQDQKGTMEALKKEIKKVEVSYSIA